MNGDIYSMCKGVSRERRETISAKIISLAWESSYRVQVDKLRKARSNGGKAPKRRERVYQFVLDQVQKRPGITAREIYSKIQDHDLEVFVGDDGRIYQDDNASIAKSSLSRYLTKAKSQLKSQ